MLLTSHFLPRFARCLGVTGAAALLVCAGVAAAAIDSAHPARPAGVAWFEGSVAEALSAARAAHKPVFVYWGAVWCPPCQELKATVFKRKDFLDRLGLFVPVFVDGDGVGAQAVGEQFHVSGYPTVLVLRSDGTELQRVSGGMDLARYAEVLDLALAQGRTARELLTALARDPAVASLTAYDCRILAYNGWDLDDDYRDDPAALAGLSASLAAAAPRCPAELRVERARLQLIAATSAIAAEAKDLAAGKAPSAVLIARLALVPAVLADAKLAQAAGDALEELDDDYFKAALAVEPKQAPALRARWFAIMDALAEDKRYSAADQLYAIRSKLIAAKALDPKGHIDPTLVRAATARIDAALLREHEPYARSSLVNAALNVLEVIDDDTRAAAILAAEVKTAAQPYYYMADLAELEEKRGHADAALDWFAAAYHAAAGPATRFQWGVGYVRGLVRLRPQDEIAIRDAALDVLTDLDAAGDLHARTRKGLKRLRTALAEWNKTAEHTAALTPVDERLRAICARWSGGATPTPECARPAS